MLYQTENQHGGDVYGGGITLDFSANTNPLGTPPGVLEAMPVSAPAISLPRSLLPPAGAGYRRPRAGAGVLYSLRKRRGGPDLRILHRSAAPDGGGAGPPPLWNMGRD